MMNDIYGISYSQTLDRIMYITDHQYKSPEGTVSNISGNSPQISDPRVQP